MLSLRGARRRSNLSCRMTECFASLAMTALIAATVSGGPLAVPKGAAPVMLSTVAFDRDAVGKPPSHFTFAVTGTGPEAHWEIQEDPFIPGHRHLLVQNGRTEPGENVALAILNDRVFQHGEIVVRFRVNGGEDDQSAGIVWRYQDPQNYYLVRASAKEDACSVYRVKKGKLKLLDTKSAIILPYTWHELRLIFVDKNFTAFVDGELTVGGKDSSDLKAGQIGLCTLSDSNIRFDSLRVPR